MKTKPLYLILIALACTGKKEESKTEIAKDSVSATATPADTTGRASACFDVREDTWFTAFNKYQNEGLAMAEADKKAIEDAEREYQNCLTGNH